jgi:hypothetical protein
MVYRIASKIAETTVKIWSKFGQFSGETSQKIIRRGTSIRDSKRKLDKNEASEGNG